jgi:predicted DNA-binding transcriptional regulator AlpA
MGLRGPHAFPLSARRRAASETPPKRAKEPDPAKDLLSSEQARQYIGGQKPISKTAFFRGIREGYYPQGRPIGPRLVRWSKRELDDALRLIAAADGDVERVARLRAVDAMIG